MSFNCASRLLGAFLCTAVLLTAGCGKKSGTPAWSKAPETAAAAPETASKPKSKPKSKPVKAAVGDPATPEAVGSLRFVGYNLENWLTMERTANGKVQSSRPKPESEKQAVVAMVARVKPDILGVCEIGTREDLADLQSRLKAAGLDLPNIHYTGGADPTRHLALLSRFPITRTGTVAKSDYRLEGRTFLIERGILDATIEANGKSYHFLGAHLKSKREVEIADQAQMRQNEARLFRDHVAAVMKAQPEERLIVYGDLNDTKGSPALKAIEGTYRGEDSLTALNLKDRQGQAWTHYWAYEDLYSRIDWILVNQVLKPEVDTEGSRVIDDPIWNQASDHRPVTMLLK